MVWLRTVVFTVVVPGTVVVLIPWLLVTRFFPASGIDLGAVRYVGVPLMAVGALIYLRCAWDFGAVGRGTPAPWDPPVELVIVGLYRFVRNPIYVGLLLMVLGEAAYFEARVLITYAVVLFVAFHLRVVFYEEPRLRAQFGEAYERYRSRVPRWIPRVSA